MFPDSFRAAFPRPVCYRRRLSAAGVLELESPPPPAAAAAAGLTSPPFTAQSPPLPQAQSLRHVSFSGSRPTDQANSWYDRLVPNLATSPVAVGVIGGHRAGVSGQQGRCADDTVYAGCVYLGDTQSLV